MSSGESSEKFNLPETELSDEDEVSLEMRCAIFSDFVAPDNIRKRTLRGGLESLDFKGVGS
jgi:hypothetical protein